MIGITGFSGAIGSEFCRYLNSLKISFLKINLRKKNIENYLKITIKKYNLKYIYNFAANLNPKSKKDIDFNIFIPEIILKQLSLNNQGTLIQISTINTLINDRKDIYSISKLKAENLLFKSKLKNFKIVRLGLVVKKKNNLFLNYGSLKFFYNYLKIPLPFYPIIFPGISYKPIDVEILNKFLINVYKLKKQVLNIQGKSAISSGEIFEIIARNNKKKISKIELPKILIKKLKNFFQRNSVLQQFLDFKNYV
jgi:dTDP-4-dehydrorhamnose reductase